LPKTLLLDLDGTLVDSVPDLRAALNRLMQARGFPPFAYGETAAMVGDGVAALVARAFAARGTAPDDRAVDEFMADYGAHAAVETRAYPEVAPTLDRLIAQGWRLAVCTNKPVTPARALLAALGLADRFTTIGGGDSFAVRKPDPGHLLATLAAAGGVPRRAVMVGDHANDVAAATGAGMPCIFAAWGYGPALMSVGAAAIGERFDQLPLIAERLLA
jgi:phosphoglycolate phosphatase